MTQEAPKPSPATAAPAAEPFIDKPEVCRRLGKKLRTIDNWMKRGIIPYYKISRTVAFKWSEVEASLRDTCRVGRRGAGVAPATLRASYFRDQPTPTHENK